MLTSLYVYDTDSFTVKNFKPVQSIESSYKEYASNNGGHSVLPIPTPPECLPLLLMLLVVLSAVKDKSLLPKEIWPAAY